LINEFVNEFYFSINKALHEKIRKRISNDEQRNKSCNRDPPDTDKNEISDTSYDGNSHCINGS